MNNYPLVSVVIPTYNRARVVGQTIDNVLQQTYSNIELIIVDDGSTDETLAVLRGYGDRIRVISQANSGPAVARNRGARVARGEMIAFQDSDDLWKPAKIERQVALLEHFGTSVPCCLCNVLMYVTRGKEYTSFDHSWIRPDRESGLWLNVADVLATRSVLFNQAAMIRREAFEKAGGFDPKLKYMEDIDLPLRLALQGPWALISETLVMYGDGGPESFSRVALKDPVVLKECELKIYEQMLAETELSEGRALFRRNLRRKQAIAMRQRRGLELGQSGSTGARAMVRFRAFLDRLYMGAFRRSPWFPQPDVLPESEWASNMASLTKHTAVKAN